MGAVVLVSFLWTGGQDRVLYSERNFFGILKVLKDPSEDYHFLQHGTTLHGVQSLDPTRRREPLVYFSRSGPLGQVFDVFNSKSAGNRVAIIGLGSGTIASYAKAGQHWTFYEIDPAVERVARDARYFTFLRDCPARLEVILGDARLSLKQSPGPPYDLIVLDAFNSDSIPVHLLTRDALKLYLSKLAPDGILAFHISNKYLDLKPVVGNLALDANLACFVQEDTELSEDDRKAKKAGSIWVVLARQVRDLRNLAEDPRWKPLEGRPGVKLWTDDYSNIPGVFKWFSSNKNR
jgi:SAM-dependent methyltransferase